MLVLIIPLLIFIGVIIYGIYEGEVGLGIVLGLTISVAVFLILVLLVGLFGACLPMEVVETETIEICALADNSQLEGQISGNAFLTRGTIKGKLKYQFLYKEEGKGYAYKAVDATDSYINYTDETPYVAIHTYAPKGKFYRWAFGTFPSYTEYIFYLPEDAIIIDNYIIDLE
jgi:hypothetical protein